MSDAKVRVLIVDDSQIVRSILRASLSSHPRIEIVGMACDGNEALQKISALKPDVVTLDVEMPNLNGIQLLERIGGKLPVGFVMCSTLTQAGASITLEALRKGALDYVAKPTNGAFAGNAEFRAELHAKVLAAAAGRERVRNLVRSNASGAARSAAPTLPPNRERGWVVAIGVSCGGPQTLHELLPAFPSDFVPIVVTQHMPAQFTKSFAQHLNDACSMKVREAVDNERLEQGTILVAPGSAHLRIVRLGCDLFTRLDPGPKVSGHRPSVDAMFDSLADSARERCVGVVLTGMGNDGAQGVIALNRVNAWTVAQDEATSLVYGMPKAAAQTGKIDRVAPLNQIPITVSKLLQSGVRRAAPAAAAVH